MLRIKFNTFMEYFIKFAIRKQFVLNLPFFEELLDDLIQELPHF